MKILRWTSTFFYEILSPRIVNLHVYMKHFPQVPKYGNLSNISDSFYDISWQDALFYVLTDVVPSLITFMETGFHYHVFY